MRLKTWLVAVLGLGSLVMLLTLSMSTASRKIQQIYAQMDQLNLHRRDVEAKLRALRSDVHLSSIFIRDYLLDVARERAPEYREQLAQFRQTSLTTLTELQPLVGRDDQVSSLQAKLNEYWLTFDPLFDWTTNEKILRSAAFLRREVVPRRQAILTIAQQIEELNNANWVAQRSEVAQRHASLADELNRLQWQTVLLGLGVAIIVVFRLRFLERQSDRDDRQLRQLSQQVVQTQEEERKNLSRELHDHVAQVLTGLRMELGRLERMTAPFNDQVSPVVADCKGLIDGMFRTVRNLALGLRPSMLDDLGLQAALEWLVRDFAGRYPITIELQIEGNFDALPDKHRTCLYRVVQEALTNAVRHGSPTRIEIHVSARLGQLRVEVTDDGIGLEPARIRSGFGLRGLQERVKELEGTMAISRPPGGGTKVAVRLPVPFAPTEESTLARVAG